MQILRKEKWVGFSEAMPTRQIWLNLNHIKESWNNWFHICTEIQLQQVPEPWKQIRKEKKNSSAF